MLGELLEIDAIVYGTSDALTYAYRFFSSIGFTGQVLFGLSGIGVHPGSPLYHENNG